MNNHNISFRCTVSDKMKILSLCEDFNINQSELFRIMLESFSNRDKAEDIVEVKSKIENLQKTKTKIELQLAEHRLKLKTLEKKAEQEKPKEVDIDALNREMGLIPQ